jgi:Rps23 Pro-64 3,4-dihydroxylase Tpa1-like proline 4-hydroxylase
MNFLHNITDKELLELGRAKHQSYIQADPFPSGYYDNLFNPQLLDEILAELPDMQKNPENVYNDQNQVKLAANDEYQFGPQTKAFLHYLNSGPFLNFLSALTGIEDLIPDPYFLGGGYHQILAGGFLKVHADFNKHRTNGLDRRINALVYLNKDWKEEYGGHFQLWDREMKDCKAKILPVYNRLAIFSTSDYSFHGHPDPLTCPPDRSRKSLAVYYYSNGRPETDKNPGAEAVDTLFKYRPEGDEEAKQKTRLSNFIQLVTPPVLYFGVKKLLNRK